MNDQPIPTLHDVVRARRNVYRFLRPTPLFQYATLSDLIGAEVWVKHENHQPTGAFKVRGGLNLAATLSGSERKAGLFTASTGNHGQSIAYAARAFDIQATIAVPEGANPGKVAAMRGMGAEVVFHGSDFDKAREWIMDVAAALKYRERVAGKKLVLVVSGGNLALERLQQIMSKYGSAMD